MKGTGAKRIRKLEEKTIALGKRIVRPLAVGALLVIFFASFIVWYTSRDVLPRKIRIATAGEGSLYKWFGDELGERLRKQTKSSVEVVPSDGSIANRDSLKDEKVHLAIIQAGAFESMDGLIAVAPLYPDVVHVIVRKSSNIGSIRDLAGKNVSLGSKETGSRENATRYSIGMSRVRELDGGIGESR